jgi:hypothetical protein
MPVTALSGLVDDSDINQSQRVVDMDDVISMLDPDTSQFTTMLMKVASKNAHSSKVEWLEDELFPRLSAVVSGGATNGANIVVTAGEGAYFRAGDIVRNARTGNAVRVISVSTDTLTVTQAIGRVGFLAAAAADQLVIIGNASAQGATLGTRKVTRVVNQFNYTQIHRSPYGFTKTLMASKLYGGSEPNRERKKKAVEHKRAIEYTLFWGTRGLDVTGSEPRGMAGGLYEFITTKVKDVAGVLTKTLLDTYMRDLLQNGSKNKVLFVSPLIAQAISSFLRDAWSPNTVGARLWGAFVDGFISGAYGYRIPVIVKKDWNDFATTGKQYGGWAFLVDMDHVQLRPLRGTQLLRDRQANDSDSYDEEYLTEFSIQVEQERAHGLIIGAIG